MKKSEVVGFLKCLNVPRNKIKAAGDKWVSCPCPLSQWSHSNQTDRNPSFGVSVSPMGESHYHCFTCGSGDLLSLVQQLSAYGVDTPQYDIPQALILLSNEDEGDVSLDIDDWREDYNDRVEDTVWPESWVESFAPAVNVPIASEYLERRSVGQEATVHLELRYDTQLNTICFPVRNWAGSLVGLRGRRVAPGDGEPRYKAYKYKGTYNPLVWYGEHRVDIEKPVLLVESVFDYASAIRVYENILAPMCSSINRQQIERVGALVDIVTLFDNGAGGDRARGTIDQRLVHVVKQHCYPPEGCSDPGDMTTTQLQATLRDYLPL